MKTIRFYLAGALILSSFALSSAPVSADWTTQTADSGVLQKSDLPDGGVPIDDPTNQDKKYYFLDLDRLRSVAANKDKYAGLYGSADGGKTWKRLAGQFEFENLFVHPKTGELFALIKDDFHYTDDKGSLQTTFRMMKAVSSIDGKVWKDIMGKQQHCSGLHGIAVDPENPVRIRLKGSGFSEFWLTSVDDQYSDWTKVFIPTGPPF